MGIAALAVSFASLLCAQAPGAEWRHLGSTVVDVGLASPASGPVERVWYSDDGGQLYVKTASGKVFVTGDFEKWQPAAVEAPAPRDMAAVASRPEPAVKLRTTSSGARVYGVGKAAYRSDDGGSSWSDLTDYRGRALLGSGLADLAVSPTNSDEIALAGSTGVWRSPDGGLSWTGLNQTLPNLQVRRIAALPGGTRGLRMVLAAPESPEFEWEPGEKSAWHEAGNFDIAPDEALKTQLAAKFGVAIAAVGASGNYLYAGSADGRLWSSSDKGENWIVNPDRLTAGVEAIFVSPRDGRVALAALGVRTAPGVKPAHVVRTMNGGIFWDDVTANLPDAAAHGIVADPASGAVYVASDAGVFLTMTDLLSAGRATNWIAVSQGLPAGAAMDVKLDSGENQLFVALDGHGIYTGIAPHRVRDFRVVNAADFSGRAAAPGGLLSVIGAKVQAAQAGGANVPVLDSNDSASQIQVPFNASGSTLALSLDASSGRLSFGMPLQSASPAIFIDPDGTPLIMDADSGFLLDRSKPAHSRSHIQILATGLGRVQPDWPAGVAAPLTNSPRVQAPVQVYLGRTQLTVTQAILAPGYIGSYLIEAEIPSIVNEGPSELWLDVQGQTSNRVRLYVSQ
jgi:uncharacterized protein (TIGR03437 family)